MSGIYEDRKVIVVWRSLSSAETTPRLGTLFACHLSENCSTIFGTLVPPPHPLSSHAHQDLDVEEASSSIAKHSSEMINRKTIEPSPFDRPEATLLRDFTVSPAGSTTHPIPSIPAPPGTTKSVQICSNGAPPTREFVPQAAVRGISRTVRPP